MNTPLSEKSSLDEIRSRFDGDVERFSKLETGQSATIDAPLVLDRLAEVAIAATPSIRRVLDLRCRAGNECHLPRDQKGTGVIFKGTGVI